MYIPGPPVIAGTRAVRYWMAGALRGLVFLCHLVEAMMPRAMLPGRLVGALPGEAHPAVLDKSAA